MIVLVDQINMSNNLHLNSNQQSNEEYEKLFKKCIPSPTIRALQLLRVAYNRFIAVPPFRAAHLIAISTFYKLAL